MTKESFYNKVEYILVTLLLVFSGNPITRFMGKYAVLLALVLIFIVMYKKIKNDFYFFALSLTAALLLLFISQYLVLGFVSWLGAFNYINTFIFATLIVYLLAERFVHKFFIILYYVSLISLVLYVFFNLLNLHPPGIEWRPSRVTYVIYTYVKQHHIRNCGMFWEPAAFAGVITLCLAMNLNQLPVLWKEHKFKVAIIVIAMLTTQSTSGYIVFFLIGIYYLLFFVRDKTIAFTLLPVSFVIGVVVYSNATFLQQKLEEQSESSLTLDKGEFSNSRFGSFIFDWRYIKKHPIVGNGFHESTRYADDPELIKEVEMGENLANANGISNFMACLGIPFIFFYVVLLFKATSKVDRRVGFIVTITVLLSLFAEQWLLYPLFTGIICTRYRKNKYQNNRVSEKRHHSSINYLPQF